MGSTGKKAVKKKHPKNYISWFEIPALDLERSVAFYDQIFGIKMEIVKTGDYAMAIFPAEKGIGGALVKGQGSIPSETGSLIYLNAGRDLQTVLDKIVPAGGRVIMTKTFIDEDSGNFALFIDSEGNKLALHSTH